MFSFIGQLIERPKKSNTYYEAVSAYLPKRLKETMKIGLTGGIGCGKSTVVESFARAGWRTIETDKVAADLLQNDTTVRNVLSERWGSQVFDSVSGAVDRKSIARIVFSDKAELDWLEKQLHPKIRMHWINACKEHPQASWLVEIPLLLEKRLESYFDFVVSVVCNDSVVDCRLAEKGFTREAISRRRNRQFPLSAKVHSAHYVLHNSGSRDFLNKQIQHLIKAICPV